jgi:RNA polymerase sigma-70 factor (ECF subfamily)
MVDVRVGEIGTAAPGAGLTDEEVLVRVRDGDHGLFEVLIRRYNQRLYRVARTILRDETEAEDVMQHAYVEAYAHLDQFAGRARFSTWITKIAVYEALARLRRRGRQVAPDSGRPESGEDSMNTYRSAEPTPEEQALTSEVRALLESAVDSLPEAYRSVFVLREVEGLSTVETAECLDVTADVIKTRLSRARSMLRQEILDRTGAATAQAFSFHLTRCDRVVAGVFERLGLTDRSDVH